MLLENNDKKYLNFLTFGCEREYIERAEVKPIDEGFLIDDGGGDYEHRGVFTIRWPRLNLKRR